MHGKVFSAGRRGHADARKCCRALYDHSRCVCLASCAPDGVEYDPRRLEESGENPYEICPDSGQINVPNIHATARLHKNSKNNVDVSQDDSLLFTNTGGRPLDWSLTLAPGSELLAGSFSPLVRTGHLPWSEWIGGVLEECRLEKVAFAFDATSVSARDSPYDFVYTLTSSSLKDDEVNITVSVFVTADMDTRKSNVTLVNSSRVSAGIMFKVVPVDAFGADIQDPSDLIYSATLTHQASQERLLCDLKYDPAKKQTEGACRIPETVCNNRGDNNGECAPPIGQFRLEVKDTDGKLVGGTGYTFIVEDCPEGYYYSEDSQTCILCDVGMGCTGFTGLTIRTVPLIPGYWRADASSTDIRRCRFHDVSCPGEDKHQATGPNPYCAPGYRGPLCSACAANFFSSWAGDGKCFQCDTGTSHLPTIVLAFGLMVFITSCIAYAFNKVQKKRQTNSSSDIRSRSAGLRENVKRVYQDSKYKIFTLFLTAQARPCEGGRGVGGVVVWPSR